MNHERRHLSKDRDETDIEVETVVFRTVEGVHEQPVEARPYKDLVLTPRKGVGADIVCIMGEESGVERQPIDDVPDPMLELPPLRIITIFLGVHFHPWRR